MLTETRNADLADLVEILKSNQEAKLDAVVPAEAITSVDGVLHVDGMGTAAPDTVEELLNPGSGQGKFVPTKQADGQIADRLGIPSAYLRKLRESRIDLYDANVNGWLQGQVGDDYSRFTPDRRRFLCRTFVDTDRGEGIFRALLSDSFKPMDHIDTLFAALGGARSTGKELITQSADLSESRMVVRMYSPDIAAVVPNLVRGYRPVEELFNRYGPGHLGWERESGPPVSFAGVEFSNSETGGGALGFCPRIVIDICKNGLKITRDLVRMVHLGGKLDDGLIRWSDTTYQKQLELVQAKAADAVAQFLSQEYLDSIAAEVEAKAGATVDDAVGAIEFISKKLLFPEDVQQQILSHFIRGGQMTAGGVLNAITSVAQVVPDAEVAFDLENKAFAALDLIAA